MTWKERRTVEAGLGLFVLLALAACGTTRDVVTVSVPTPVSCVPEATPTDQPQRRVIPSATGPAIQAMAGELLERRAYDDQAAPVIAGCRAAAAPATGPPH